MSPLRERVDDHHVVVGREVLDQRERLVVGHHLHARQAEGRDALGHEGPDAVVAAGRVADPDHERAHPSSTVRSRKWVAQEMHGS